MRASLCSYFRVHIRGGDLERRWLSHQIANGPKELLVGIWVHGPGVCLVVVINRSLELVSTREQLPLTGGELSERSLEAGPERGRIDSRPWQRFSLDEAVQNCGYAHRTDLNSLGHGVISVVLKSAFVICTS
ncbi:hypothetical protein NOCA2360011 [metagenome]|uniref:Uncharacterized protein n=1 Tax=metagenome TaxID=256318 RepID=A0A2P2C3W7_9ZZZZ